MSNESFKGELLLAFDPLAAAARGLGVGRALIEEVYRRAREVGAPRVYWQTQESNSVARQLYDKVADLSGFIVYRKQL